jgi:hypothetical protein
LGRMSKDRPNSPVSTIPQSSRKGNEAAKGNALT